MNKRLIAALPAAALLTFGLAACGGESDEFCSQLEEFASDPSAITDLESAQGLFEDLSASAPEDLKPAIDGILEGDTSGLSDLMNYATENCG